jgi:hypothetical protein
MITFQGDDATARNELKQAFIASSKKRLFGRCDGRSFYGTLNSLYPTMMLGDAVHK